MRKWLLLGLLLLFSSQVQATTVTTTLKGPDGVITAEHAHVTFTLKNYQVGKTIPRKTGTFSALPPKFTAYPDATGLVSVSVTPNSQIKPDNTRYEICYYYEGVKYHCCELVIPDQVPAFNLDDPTVAVCLNSVAQPDLSQACPTGEVATGISSSGALICTSSVRVCNIVAGADNGSVLASLDIAPQSFQCKIPRNATILEVNVHADAGTSSVIPGFVNPSSVVFNLTSGALATAAAGGEACSNVAGGLGLDGVTTCSATLQNTSVVAGSYLQTISGTSAGSPHIFTASVVFTME